MISRWRFSVRLVSARHLVAIVVVLKPLSLTLWASCGRVWAWSARVWLVLARHAEAEVAMGTLDERVDVGLRHQIGNLAMWAPMACVVRVGSRLRTKRHTARSPILELMLRLSTSVLFNPTCTSRVGSPSTSATHAAPITVVRSSSLRSSRWQIGHVWPPSP